MNETVNNIKNESLSEAVFTVKTPLYEGPFDLLLDLIEKRKLLINDISLAEVTEEYIRHVNETEGTSPEETSSFVMVAATLLFIKSRSLLPVPLEVSEEEDIAELKLRLELYDVFRLRAKDVGSLFGQQLLYSQYAPPPHIVVFAPGPLTFEKIREALENVFKTIPEETIKLSDVAVRKVASLEDTIDMLAKRIEKSFRLSFREFVGGKAERVEVIVSFLAILELVKRGAVEVLQHEDFSDMQLSKNSVSTPQYG
jgi:segregation and condensation protein A